MKENGKTLERIIRLIEETFINNANTQIFKNYKINNNSGNKREIDILIKSKVNNYEIIIAIECKDYKRKVSAKEVEAFNSKCLRINSINKKVLISQNGFQKDAIESPRDFGIDLLIANKVNTEIVFSWLSIKQLGLIIENRLSNTTVFFEADEDLIEQINKSELFIYNQTNDSPKHLDYYILEAIKENKDRIWNVAIIQWLTLDEEKKFDSFQINFNIQFQGLYAKVNDLNINLLGVNSGVYVKFKERPANIIDARVLRDNNNKILANSISIDVNSKVISDIIINKEKKTSFFETNQNDESIKLQTLFTYDPKTKEFKK
ncbi:MAG TPA: restriction endonuclease [Tenuifilaceae bacterium]|nr:restriction endonuclease [Tenuifilaceae bacterium]HPI44068.1 restriction endonuclease [Tenuifilaceae bacterium]HPN22430.1 restriction endonuclease [Tenuifilaceae bacterium]